MRHLSIQRIMNKGKKEIERHSSRPEVERFLRKVASTPTPRKSGERGRLIFALDATASREPTWDQATHIQSEMFSETRSLGGLEIQLVYYRGFREFEASPWCSQPQDLLPRMTRVSCIAGQTQIGRVLQHALDETRKKKINALVFVGDCMEEAPDLLARLAGELGMLGVPAFLFHEGMDPVAEKNFRHIARLSCGAYCRFDAGSAKQLRDLLSAVAVYAAGGRKALEAHSQRTGGIVLQLTHQLGKKG